MKSGTAEHRATGNSGGMVQALVGVAKTSVTGHSEDEGMVHTGTQLLHC